MDLNQATQQEKKSVSSTASQVSDYTKQAGDFARSTANQASDATKEAGKKVERVVDAVAAGAAALPHRARVADGSGGDGATGVGALFGLDDGLRGFGGDEDALLRDGFAHGARGDRGAALLPAFRRGLEHRTAAGAEANRHRAHRRSPCFPPLSASVGGIYSRPDRASTNNRHGRKLLSRLP